MINIANSIGYVQRLSQHQATICSKLSVLSAPDGIAPATMIHQFLTDTLPAASGAVYCLDLPLPHGGPGNHLWCSSIQELGAEMLLASHVDQKQCWFSPALFNPGSMQRTAENVSHLKTMKVDLDVGQGANKYLNQQAALAALDAFSFKLGLTPTWTISSGGGLHAYWCFKDVVPVSEWKALAVKFKAILGACGVLADPAVTADPSRLMRPIGSIHRKDPKAPKWVWLVRDRSEVTTFEAFAAAVARIAPVVEPRTLATANNPVQNLTATIAALADPQKRGWSVEVAEDLLRYIDPAIEYEKWRQTVSAVCEWSDGRDAAYQLVKGWSMGALHGQPYPKWNAESFGKKWAEAYCKIGEPRNVGFSRLRELAVAGGYVEMVEIPASDWPEAKPIDAPLPNVLPFDYAQLPESFRLFVEDQAELMQVPADMIAVPLMIAAAAAIGNGVTICPKARDTGWQVAPVLWGGIVGRPGVMKSPSIDRALKPLSLLEGDLAAAFELKRQKHVFDKLTHETTIAQAKKQIKDGVAGIALPVEPEAPQPERLIVNDSTVQKLGEILVHSPKGVLVSRDELVSLLETLASTGQEGARGFYLEAWNGLNSYRVDRVGRGSTVIPRLALWVVGGIQPGKLQSYVRQATGGGNGDDGLLQRFQMIVWPDPRKGWKNIDRPQKINAGMVVESTFKRLRSIDPVAIGANIDPFGNRPAFLQFSSEAQEVFNRWMGKLQAQLAGDDDDSHAALESHLSKYKSLIPALALVAHLVDDGCGPVTLAALEKAIAWGDYLWSHAMRVYSVAIDGGKFSAKALADKISSGKLADGFSAREIYKREWQYLTTPDDTRKAIEWLIDAGWLISQTKPPSTTGGRPTEVFLINPMIHSIKNNG